MFLQITVTDETSKEDIIKHIEVLNFLTHRNNGYNTTYIQHEKKQQCIKEGEWPYIDTEEVGKIEVSLNDEAKKTIKKPRKNAKQDSVIESKLIDSTINIDEEVKKIFEEPEVQTTTPDVIEPPPVEEEIDYIAVIEKITQGIFDNKLPREKVKEISNRYGEESLIFIKNLSQTELKKISQEIDSLMK